MEGGDSEQGSSLKQINEDQRLHTQESDGLKTPSHCKRRLNRCVSRVQQEFDTEHSTKKCREIELEMQMPIPDRRTTCRGNRTMQLLNLMGFRMMSSMRQISGINMHCKPRILVAARVIFHVISGKSRTRMFNRRFRLGW